MSVSLVSAAPDENPSAEDSLRLVVQDALVVEAAGAVRLCVVDVDVVIHVLFTRCYVEPAQVRRRAVRIEKHAFVVAGYGVAIRGDGKTAGTVRAATLVATGQPGTLQIRLADPVTKGERPGLGACTGDSGAPVYREVGHMLAVIGVVSWSTGPAASEGCGGLTGVTPLARYRAWIIDQSGRMGAPLPP